jgi:hypothetical protein
VREQPIEVTFIAESLLIEETEKHNKLKAEVINFISMLNKHATFKDDDARMACHEVSFRLSEMCEGYKSV